MKRPSAELKRIARENLRGHYALPIGASMVASIITTVALLPFNFIYQLNRTNANFVFYYAASFIISLVSTILSCGLIRIHLKLARRETPVFSDLFYCFTRRPDRFLLEELLIMGISLACMLPGALILIISTFTESIPLIILGIVLLPMGFVAAFILALCISLALMLLTDHDSMSVMEAFHTSFRLMSGNKGRLFYIQLSFLGWELLALLSCGIGILWLSPYMNQTTVEFYRDVTGELDRNDTLDNESVYIR